MNTQYGIELRNFAHNNLMHSNIMIGNTKHAVEETGTNFWDLNGIGNYWDDYDGEGPYFIYGPNGEIINQDNFPIINL